DIDRNHAVLFLASDIGDLAVIDRFDEARLDQAAFEEGAPPFRDRQMHHVGHDIDAGNETAAEAETVRHRIVVYLVFGQFGGVVGLDAIGFDRARHSSSFLPLNAASDGTPRERLSKGSRQGSRQGSPFAAQWATRASQT